MAAKPFVPSSSTWLDPTMTTDHWCRRQLATVHTQPHQLMHNPSCRQLSALMQPTNHNYLAIRQTVSSNTLKTTHYDFRPLSKAYYKYMHSRPLQRSNGLGMGSLLVQLDVESTLQTTPSLDPNDVCMQPFPLYYDIYGVPKWTRYAYLKSCGGFRGQVGIRTSAVRLADPVDCTYYQVSAAFLLSPSIPTPKAILSASAFPMRFHHFEIQKNGIQTLQCSHRYTRPDAAALEPATTRVMRMRMHKFARPSSVLPPSHFKLFNHVWLIPYPLPTAAYSP